MRIALVLALLLLGGCGQAVDFGGDPDVPDGYETYSGMGVSFAHPKLPQQADDDKVRFGDENAFVELRVAGNERLEPYVRSYVALAEGAGRATVDVTEQEVPKADGARLLEVKAPKGLESRILIVARGGDVLLLSAGGRGAAREKVDADAVISSFRLR
jgi:hypothetical protein